MSPDFNELLDNFKKLKPGSRADLRRAASPEALRNLPVYHRLTHGQISDSWLRTLFILGSLKPDHFSAEKISVGRAFANVDKGVPKEDRLTPVGVRLVQIDRAVDGRDITQLRRLIDYLEPKFYWPALARTLYYWDANGVAKESKLPSNKKQILEDYFRAKYATKSN